jgi:hypothetical protein
VKGANAFSKVKIHRKKGLMDSIVKETNIASPHDNHVEAE